MSLHLMGKKKGMTRFFDQEGQAAACTVIAVEPNVIVQLRKKEKEGYEAVQIGAEKASEAKKRNITKPLLGHYAAAKVEPRKKLLESRVDVAEKFSVGQEIGVEIFSDCTHVDVIGISKGKGFQGAVKRYGFAGGPATHGSSGFHRKLGSTGMRTTPGRGLPGKKMPGHMGSERVTMENLEIIKIDIEKQLILVKGAVPGHNNALVVIRKAKKKQTKSK